MRLKLMAMFLTVLLLPIMGAYSEEWPQWRGPGRDGVWSENGIIKEFASSKLESRWRAPIAAGYCGPTVANGRVYVMDRVTQPEEVERVHCFDWKTGDSLWSHSYPCSYRIDYPLGPRASVTINDGYAYALGAMGYFHCFDAAKGTVIWEKDLNKEFELRVPIWGISASPLVDGNRVILHVGGSDGACVIALNKKTGEEIWRALDDKASYSAPIIVNQAGKRILVVWTGESVSGLNPESGEVYWTHPFKPSRMVLNVATPVFDRNRIFVSAFYDGSLMLKLKQDAVKVEEIWRKKGPTERRTISLHSIISTPIVDGDYIYGVDSYGELRCLKAENGERIWEDLTAVPKGRWANIHMVQNGDKVWMFNELGELIISQLTPKGFHEIDRAKLIEPTTDLVQRRYKICWSHPAFAYKHVFARNDKELICVDLSAGE